MDETIWKQSLGRSVSLGDCYDATTEKFTGHNIFTKQIPNEVIRKQDITNQSWNYDFSNSTTSKLSMLNLDGELKLSLLCDMLPNISGSAKFIKNKTTNKEEVRCTFALFTNTIEQRIEINDMALCDIYDKRIESFKGTHVVTRLKWGANAVAELFIENDEKIGKMEIAGAIKANLGKIGGMALSDATIQGSIKHESFDLSKVTKIRWSVNADVISNTKTPKNAEEALNIIYHLPEQIKENGNGRPLEFCLLPLKELKDSLGYAISNNVLFYKIESTAVLKVEQQFTEIESSRLDLLTLQNFMTRNIEFVTPNELKTVKEFLNAFDISFMEFQQFVAAKLNQIRSGKAEQIELLKIIEKFKEESNATSSKVKEFLSLFETMEKRITLLRDVTSKGIIFIKNFAEFESTLLISNKDIYVLAYSFKSIKDNHQWLENYLYFSKLHEQHNKDRMFCMIDFDITPEIQRNQNLPAEIQIHNIFNGKFVEKNIFKEIKLFESVCSVRCTAVHEKSGLSCDNRSPIYMPCASSLNGGQCSKKYCGWYCVKCLSILEYGFNNKFYCWCGCQTIENYEFKCDHHKHGYAYVKFSEEELQKHLLNVKKRKKISILLLGQTGTGKTTLIKTAKMICSETSKHPDLKKNDHFVGISRSISDEEHLSLIDDEDEETRTTTCQGYTFSYGKYVLSFIDSPGIGNKRGIEQDKKHLEEIFNYVKKNGSLNAICIVIKGKEQLLSNYCLMEYLSNIPKSFVKNILFCFTDDLKAAERKHLLYECFKDSNMDEKIKKHFLSSHISVNLNNTECNNEEEKYNTNAKIFYNFVKHCEKISESDTNMTSQTFKPHATIASTLQDEKVIFEHIENGCNEAILTVKNLLHAPEACCMVEALIILACCTKDPSLISAEGIKTFRYLRTPGSYKSSLYQVINSVWNAFRVAYNSMQRIQLSLSGMPDLLNDLMEATNNLEEQDSQDIINNSLAAIEKSANKCVHSARDADDEFEVTLEVIEELLRAAISTLGHSEHRAEAAEIDLQEQDVDLKDMADYLREGIQQLSKVQIAWRNIVTFFYYIKNFVDYSLMHHIEGITIYVEQISENQQTFFSTSKCRILLREVTKACAVANVLMQSVGIYKTIHNSFVKPTVEKSIVNIGLTQAEAQARQCDIVSNFTEIKDGVEETIETYTQSLTDNVYDAMKAQGFEITRDMEGKKTTRTTR